MQKIDLTKELYLEQIWDQKLRGLKNCIVVIDDRQKERIIKNGDYDFFLLECRLRGIDVEFKEVK